MDAKMKAWIDSHQAELDKYKGQWVTIHLGQDEVVSHSLNMNEALEAFHKKFPGKEAILHCVPTGDEEYFTL